MALERIKVAFNGKATTISMDSSILEIISALKGDKARAAIWIRTEVVPKLEVTAVNSPSLSRRVQAACVNEVAMALRELQHSA